MLNLRQFNNLECSTSNSNMEHLSKFSVVNFRVPSEFLGNLGEPLDHNQAEQYGCEDDNDAGEMVASRNEEDTQLNSGTEGITQHDYPATETSGTRRDEESPGFGHACTDNSSGIYTDVVCALSHPCVLY